MANEFEKRTDYAELIGFDFNSFYNGMKKELHEEVLVFEEKKGYFEKIICDSLEFNIVEENISSQRGIYQYRDEEGRFISIKNIRFNIYGLTIAVLTLGAGLGSPYLSTAIFLASLFQCLSIKINQKQLLIYTILVDQSKDMIITDDNVVLIINDGLKGTYYSEMEKEEIFYNLNKLIKLKIIDVDGGKYEMKEKLRVTY